MMLVTHYRRRSCHGENFVLFDPEKGYMVINSGGGILINLLVSGSLPGLPTNGHTAMSMIPIPGTPNW
jgi:hypothetical protein